MKRSLLTLVSVLLCLVSFAQAPSNPTFSGDTSLCRNESTTITAFGEPNATFNWYNVSSGGISFQSGSTLNRSYSSVGTYTYYVEQIVSGFSSFRTMVTINVHPNPVLSINGGGPVCEGASTTLIISGAPNYQWSTGETSSSILVSPTSNTNYSVVGTSSFGCTSSKSTSVTIETISSVLNKTICAGESTTLSTSGGASSYLWSPGLITGSSITVSPTTTTTYTVVGSFSTTGCTSQKSATVTVKSTPGLANIPLSNFSVNSGEIVNLTVDSCISCDTYNWTTNHGRYGTLQGTSVYVVPTNQTTYTVTPTNNNGCSGVSASVTVSINDFANVNGNFTIIGGDSTTLSASGTGPFTWYDDSVSTTPIFTGNTFNTGILTTTKNYWISDNSGPRKKLHISIIGGLSSLQADVDTFCVTGQSVSLSAVANTGYINWYTTSTGGTPIGSSIDGQNFIVNPTQTTTYYAEKVSARRDSIINYTGGVQIYIVPDSVFSIDLDIAGGASGLKQISGASEYRGKGGRVTSTMNVNPGDTLYLYVGGIGSSSNGGSGGWNGGGQGGHYAAAGGGASDIRINGTELVNRVIVAGGGGSNGSSQFGTNTGGHGGGLTGGTSTIPGYYCVVYGGNQSRGGSAPSCGSGGPAGRSGSFGVGGGGLGYTSTYGSWGGGGGGGWFGGAQGAVYNPKPGGGGGSSYTSDLYNMNVVHTRGFNNSSGYIKISYSKTQVHTVREGITIVYDSLVGACLDSAACNYDPSAICSDISKCIYPRTSSSNVFACDSLIWNDSTYYASGTYTFVQAGTYDSTNTNSSTLFTHNSIHSANGSAGVHFNIINNSSSPLNITGFSQGSHSTSYSVANNINVYYMPAPYVVAPTGWTQVANTVPITFTTNGTFASPVYSTLVPITPVLIPAGATYGFYVGGTSTVSYATATASGAAGSVVASDSLMSVTSGVGGYFGTGSYSPRAPVLQINYSSLPVNSNGLECDSIATLVLEIGVKGCTDSLACNYDSSATCDDGSCIFADGCTDSLACNYNPLALCDDGSCILPDGCTDSLACNYNPLANCDDNSCQYVSGCTDSLACNYNPLAFCDDGSCKLTYGCTDSLACNYNPLANCDDNSCQYVSGCIDSLACNYNPLAFCDDGSCKLTYGCTDSLACNYNILATCEDNSCKYISGCTDILACNYDSLATCDDGSCSFPPSAASSPVIINDSINSKSLNLFFTYYMDAKTKITYTTYDLMLANIDTTSSFMINELAFFISSQTGQAGTTIMNNAILTINGVNVWSGNHQAIVGYNNFVFSNSYNYTGGNLVVEWCHDNSAYTSGENYFMGGDGFNNNEAFTHYADWASGSVCHYSMDSIYNNMIHPGLPPGLGPGPDAFKPNLYLNMNSSIVSTTSYISGCTDSLACNYNPLAECDDGSCLLEYGCTNPLACNYDSLATCDDGSCNTVYGCMDHLACNYDSLASCDDGSCQLIYGCTDPIACNYDSLATCEDNSCVFLAGCTDSLACNYNPLAACDDGSCLIYYGCTNPMACNYDSLATCDDGSCLIYYGCTDSLACNYNPFAGCDDGTCNTIYGCTNPIACNYDSLATCDDGSCLFAFGCTDSTALNYNPLATCDDGSCLAVVSGCTYPTACNYNPGANLDDGSCEWISCAGTCGAITGVNLTDIIHDRLVFNWDDMNTSTCVVDQIRIRYRVVGTTAYSIKTMGAPVGNSAPCLKTSSLVLNLTPSTQYEYDFKIWYQNGKVVSWHANGTFTTADQCLNATNVAATPNNTTKTTFSWDAPASPWSFVRLKYRIDSAGTSFNNIGGFGVFYPNLSKVKNGLTPGTNYRVMWRTWCNTTGGPYRSPQWDGPVIWTQPSSIRLEAGGTISKLDVYPNPSKDVFNVRFTSEGVQDLGVRVINIVGEIIYIDYLEQFVGEYTKSIDLATYTKGVYFLEITTDNGIVSKKLVLQ